ncbi:hypothetical protein H5410_049024 [Solanum commersonii]|uniref:Uncharacterized protein n=1 Tax=Solanum commersonii TaxID=4109 RepID=A0A9J5XNI5_SOLCO|nr:hypothetical protein H5410_049024 [Solanum commersonii]
MSPDGYGGLTMGNKFGEMSCLRYLRLERELEENCQIILLHDGDAMSMPLNITTTLVLYDITNQAIDFTDTIHTLQKSQVQGRPLAF